VVIAVALLQREHEQTRRRPTPYDLHPTTYTLTPKALLQREHEEMKAAAEEELAAVLAQVSQRESKESLTREPTVQNFRPVMVQNIYRLLEFVGCVCVSVSVSVSVSVHVCMYVSMHVCIYG